MLYTTRTSHIACTVRLCDDDDIMLMLHACVADACIHTQCIHTCPAAWSVHPVCLALSVLLLFLRARTCCMDLSPMHICVLLQRYPLHHVSTLHHAASAGGMQHTIFACTVSSIIRLTFLYCHAVNCQCTLVAINQAYSSSCLHLTICHTWVSARRACRSGQGHLCIECAPIRL